MTPPLSSTEPRPHWHAMLVAVAALAVGVWLTWCWGSFNSSSWNDVRLAPVFGLKLDGAVYGGMGGPPNTWMYGPLPVWSLWPATWAPDPASALGAAGLLNMAFTLLAIAAVCAWTPLPGVTVRPLYRLLATLLAIALWPRATWQFIQADNLAVATGLIANLLLMRSRGSCGAWFAAVFATAGLLCKQTAIAVPAAQVLWLLLTLGWRPAGVHLVRLAVAGAAWLALAFSAEDPAAIWFTLITVPGGLPWATDLGARFADTAAALALQLSMPAVGWWALHRSVAGKVIALPTLAWLIAAPPGLAAMLTYGGNINSMQGFALWLPVGALALIVTLANRCSSPRLLVTTSLLIVGVCGFNLGVRDSYHFGLNTARYADASAIARAHPGRVWFPWHPLVTIFTEGKRYADEDGIAVRALAGQGLTREALAAHLPSEFAAIALPAGTPNWGVAYELRAPRYARWQVGEWLVDDWIDVSTQP